MNKKIRLDQKTLDSICKSFKAVFSPEDELWLFGSRARADARGGDIDLFIKAHRLNAEQAVQAKLDFLTQLFLKIEEQKVDVVIQYAHYHLLIHDIAQEEGIRLL